MAKLGVNPIIVVAANEIITELCKKLEDEQKVLLSELNDLENNRINVKNTIYGKGLIDEISKKGGDE